MAEFDVLPFSAKDRFKDNAWHELRTAIINRQQLVDVVYGISLDPNQNPTEISAGDLPGLIINYRSKIDQLAPYFYIESDLQAGTETTYTAATLHNAAFGYNNSGWDDPADNNNLTPVTRPHKALWNDMKACLDLMIWVRVDTGTTWSGGSNLVQLPGTSNNAIWNVSRATAFAGMVLTGNPPASFVGRIGGANLVAGMYISDVGGAVIISDNFAITGDLTSVTSPPSLVDGYLRVSIRASVPLGGVKYLTAQDYDVDISGVEHSDSPISIIADTPEMFQFTADIIAATDLSGINNEMKIEWQGIMTTDIGIIEWPAPALGGDTWNGGGELYSWAVYLKFSWDNIPSASPSATPSISPSAS